MNPEVPAATETTMRQPRSTSGRWPRSLATQRAVLDAAGALFADKGYETTSIDDIVKKSGVSVGSIYHQFNGKADVFLALASERLDQHGDASRREMAKASAKGASATEVYLAGAEGFLMSTWRDRDVSRVILGDQGPPGYAALRRKNEMRMSHRADSLRLVGTAPTPDSAAHAVAALMNAAGREIVDVDTVAKARKVARYYTGLIGHLVDAG